MISIIMCSIKPELNEAITKNIAATIGSTSFEIVTHDNRTSNWGLAKVYNYYANEANGDILCFIHEDVRILTNNWGKIIEEFYYKNQNIGVIGFAGSTLKTKTNTGWCFASKFERQNLTQGYKDGSKLRIINNPHNETFSRVVVLDGLCLIVNKNVWNENKFDEKTFDKFHLYDLDFTLQIAHKYNNFVCYTIDIEHFSEGTFDNNWNFYSDKFHQKWFSKLPFALKNHTKNEILNAEAVASYNLARNQFKDPNRNLSGITIYKGHWTRGYSFKNNLKLLKYLLKSWF